MFPPPAPHLAYHRAGPRERVFFEPSEVRAAIVTCGGLRAVPGAEHGAQRACGGAVGVV